MRLLYLWLFKAECADSAFLLAISIAAYIHLGSTWLIYAITIASAMFFVATFRDMASWPRYVGDCINEQAKAVNFLGKCIRDKNIHHTGNISNR